MTGSISLNGKDWLCKGFLGEDWVGRKSHLPASRDIRGWISATVPGSVLADLWQAGEIPDPYFEKNSLLSEWVPERAWIYKKTFIVPEEYQGSQAGLVFRGVDYEARFFLNGEELGQHRCMFIPVRFDVSGQLRYGQENLLAVVISPAPQEQSQVGRTSLVRTQKTRKT